MIRACTCPKIKKNKLKKRNITLVLFVFQNIFLILHQNDISGSRQRPLKHIAFVLTRKGKLLNSTDRRGCAEQSCRIFKEYGTNCIRPSISL